MGLDFIKKAAPTFHKALDRRAVELRTPTLFNRDIPALCRSASAEICKGANLALGEKVHLRILNKKLVALRINIVVAEFAAPPAEFFERVNTAGGIGKGVVTAVHELSETAEIGFCE
jgi:hypothetical protein